MIGSEWGHPNLRLLVTHPTRQLLWESATNPGAVFFTKAPIVSLPTPAPTNVGDTLAPTMGPTDVPTPHPTMISCCGQQGGVAPLLGLATKAGA